MLELTDARSLISRRKLLTIGSLGLGGLALPTLLASQAKGSTLERADRRKSVIFLFQQGGPSQHETLDPKPLAPSGVRTVTDVIPTTIPGVHFGSSLPQLAKLADKFTVVRSFQTNNGGHNIQPIVGPDSLETNIGVHYSRVVGATRPESGVPTGAVLFPQSLDPKVPKGAGRGDLHATGEYGKGFAPFSPGGKGPFQEDMELRLPHDRLHDRRQLLSGLDRLHQQMEDGELEAMDDIRSQAYSVLLGGGVSKALDLSLEDPRVVARYDTSPYVKKGAWNHKNRGKRGYYDSQAKTIGKLLLMAKRLCQAGCGFVTVHAGYEGVWDMHADGNNLNMVEGMQAVGYSFDHAVAAFIEDLEASGMKDDILLVCCGEMGRTPKVNSRGGRDHWSKLAPLLLYGGGLAGGQVIGQSDSSGGEPTGDELGPKNLISTIMHTLFDIPQLRLVQAVPPEVMNLAAAEPIRGLVG